jgi:hypothetical protein
MYKRHIEVQKNLVFLSEISNLNMNIVTKMFPEDVTFYVEEGNDWWIEREPFAGREKDEKVRDIALEVFKIAIDSINLFAPSDLEEKGKNLLIDNGTKEE